MILLSYYDPKDIDDVSFTETSPLEGKVVAVYAMQTHESVFIELWISEYESGKFWTIFDREDYLGTLHGAINFLNSHL